MNLARIENEKTFNPHDHYVRHIQSGMEVYGTLSRYFGKDAEAIEKMQKVMDAVNLVGDENDANFDNSDPMTDYCHIGYYVYIKIGGDTESTEFQYAPAKSAKNKVVIEDKVAETI